MPAGSPAAPCRQGGGADDLRFFEAECVRALLGVLAYAIAGLVGVLLSVPAALVVLLLLPIFYGLSSNGSYDLRRRLRHRR
ncbi:MULTISPECIES: hypothetical protein [Micromonospora]|uniref:hypothetical protein n=1 Tax=Micromonospora TaxID=1873 RepID=UPI0001BF2E3F|nr:MULTISPECIES: hypothetical protein [Micromonospora]ADL48522.1 hypothetical protein Micau_5014 [Micromonospora aurantiaca ATCC 27029]OHX06076.1 hypothetical protein BFV98_25330 [Micromonospora sp. WMMB235]SCL42092.1 hypothetical protein GA0070615_5293 [Micromonospora aurantiaca]